MANWPGPTKKRVFLNSLCLLYFLSFQAEYFSNQLPGVLDNLHRIEIERSHYLKTVNPWHSLFLLSPTKNHLDLTGAGKMHSCWASHHPNHLKVPSGLWASPSFSFVDFAAMCWWKSWLWKSSGEKSNQIKYELMFSQWYVVFLKNRVQNLCFRRATE